ncbi:MAG: protein kinase [Clostridia bacterium]|nr:protein kinase [Clostridia bacterium]
MAEFKTITPRERVPMNFKGKTINKKYVILEQLGEGGMGSVVKAYDVAHKSNVAMKFMKENVTSTYVEDLIRFKREIEIVSSFNHPNIIKIFDVGEYQNSPYIVMELLEGEPLSDFLEHGKKIGRENAVEVIRQLADVLDYVHNNGIIHRDLKPGNIFMGKYSKEISLKLIDFGMSIIMELGEISGEKEVIGTFGYMSPEATGILNKKVDERSDLYSLGIIFYQLLTGKLPFEGRDVNSLLHQQVALIPEPLRKINPDVPEVLEAIVLKLLMKDPDMRYQSARGLLYDIERYKNGEWNFTPGEKDGKIKLTYQTTLVAREKEIEKIKTLFNEAKEGRGSLCLISGEAGVGKSRLVEEIRGFVYENDGIFIRGRCLNHENKPPYQPFKDAIDEYITKVLKTENVGKTGRRLKSIVGDLGGVVTKLNIGIESLIGETKEPVELVGDRENQRFLMVVSDFICHLADEGKVCVLFLDDLQWSDDGSLRLLEEILRKLDSSNLFVVGTYRDNETGKEHRLSRIKSESKLRGYQLEEIKLSSFSLDDISRLISGVLGEKEEIVGDLAAYILIKSNGNPFFAINILRELVENRTVLWKDGKWEKDIDRLKNMPVSDSLINIILKRTEGLSEEQNDLLCKAAIIGREFDIELLYRLSELSTDKIVSFIDETIEMQLLERGTERGKILFVHDRVRDAFYYKINANDKRKIHLEIARVIEDMNRGNEEKVIFELAHHYYEGGGSLKTLEYVIYAAARAKSACAMHESIKYYSIAKKVLDVNDKRDTPEWIRINEELVQLYCLVGKTDEAIQLAEEISPLINRFINKVRLYKFIGIAYFKKGEWEKGEESQTKALELLGEKVPRGSRQVKLFTLKELIIHILHTLRREWYFNRQMESSEEDREIIWAYLSLHWTNSLSDLNKLAYSILRTLNIAESRVGRSQVLGTSISGYAALCMTAGLFNRSLKYHNIAIKLRKEIGDEWGIAKTMQHLGFKNSWEGKYAESIKCFENCLEVYKRIGDIWEEGLVYNGLGNAYRYIGEYKKSFAYFNEYMELSQRTDDAFGIIVAKVQNSRCYIEVGELDTAEELANEVINLSKQKKIWLMYCCGLINLGCICLERENYDEAIKVLQEAKIFNEKNLFLKDYTVGLYTYLAEAYLKKFADKILITGIKLGLRDRAMLRSVYRNALTKTRSWANHYGSALRAAANYYVLIREYKKAESSFIKSIEYLGNINKRYEQAKSYYEYGNFLKTLNRREEAKENWEKAHRIFNEIGAFRYFNICSELLGYNSKGKESETKTNTRDRLMVERRIATVLTTSRYISSILDVDELLEKIIDEAMELVGAERGILMLYPDDDVKKLEMNVVRNVTKEEIESKEFIVSKSIISKIEEEKKSLIISDAMLDEKLKTQSSVVVNKIRSAMCAPIITRGQMLGVIYLDSSLLSGLFSKDDLDILNLISSQAGVSIENARLYTRLKLYSTEIEKSRDEIAKWSQTLEQRVIERTERLEFVNNELNMKNAELRIMNKQLKEYAVAVEELAVARERNRVAMAMHDTLGHTMSILLKLLEASKISCSKDPEKTEKELSRAIDIAREGLKEVRHSVSGLMPETLEEAGLVTSLQKLITDYQSSGINVDFTVDGIFDYRCSRYYNAIYRTCQEALTNSLRHGKARNIAIILKFINEKVRLYIVDDGNGCKEINKGFGLTGMEKRITDLKGNISYTSDGENGFNIFVEFPMDVQD